MRSVTKYPLVWRGIECQLEVERIRIGTGGGDGYIVTSTTGMPLPSNHWDGDASRCSWSVAAAPDDDWFAEQHPDEYALDVLDGFAAGNDHWVKSVIKHEVVAAKAQAIHIEATRQGELF